MIRKGHPALFPFGALVRYELLTRGTIPWLKLETVGYEPMDPPKGHSRCAFYYLHFCYPAPASLKSLTSGICRVEA